MLYVLVYPSDVRDRRAVEAVVADLRGRPGVECLFADIGCQYLAGSGAQMDAADRQAPAALGLGAGRSTCARDAGRACGSASALDRRTRIRVAHPWSAIGQGLETPLGHR
jgi:hypothetical protein